MFTKHILVLTCFVKVCEHFCWTCRLEDVSDCNWAPNEKVMRQHVPMWRGWDWYERLRTYPKNVKEFLAVQACGSTVWLYDWKFQHDPTWVFSKNEQLRLSCSDYVGHVNVKPSTLTCSSRLTVLTWSTTGKWQATWRFQPLQYYKVGPNIFNSI